MRVEDNVAKGNAVRGFAFGDVTSSTLISNKATGNGEGFVLAASSNNKVVSNTASDNTLPSAAGPGFWIREGSTGNVVRGNTAKGNADAGFIVDASDDNRLIGNTADANHGGGFGISNVSSAVLSGNRSVANQANGFVFLASHDLQIEDNVAKDSPWACFGLYDGTYDATLVGNTAGGCSAGFDLDRGAQGNTLRGNTANGNVGGNGFSLYDTTDNTLANNTANGNGNGFLVEGAGATGNTLSRNAANTNAGYGFVADQGATGNTFSGNSAHQNDRSNTDCLDALDTGVGNTWVHNHFGTTSGI